MVANNDPLAETVGFYPFGILWHACRHSVQPKIDAKASLGDPPVLMWLLLPPHQPQKAANVEGEEIAGLT